MTKKSDFDHTVKPNSVRFKMRKGSLGAQLVDLFPRIDEDGFASEISVIDANGDYLIGGIGNGSSVTRKTSAIAKVFNVVPIRVSANKKSKIKGFRLAGYAKNTFDNRIPQSVRNHYKGARCVIADTTGNIEIDHKDGRKDDYSGVTDPDEFQPMKEQNNAYGKRTHCNTCRETDQRYDARRLGYALPVSKGSLDYEGTCIGCYWYDPPAFNKEVTRHLLPAPIIPIIFKYKVTAVARPIQKG